MQLRLLSCLRTGFCYITIRRYSSLQGVLSGFERRQLTCVHSTVQTYNRYIQVQQPTASMVHIKGVVGDWDLSKCTPQQIEADAEKLIQQIQQLVDGVAAVPLDKTTYETVLKPLEEMQRVTRTQGSLLELPQHCVEDKTVRDASTKAEEKMEKFSVEINMRSDVFERLLRVQANTEEVSTLTAEQQRFIKKQVKQGRRYGLHLSSEVQVKVKALKTKESELSIKFSANLNADDTKLYFTKEDLDGVPADIVKEFPVGSDGKLEVTIKYPHLIPITKLCRVSETRRIMMTAADRKCMKENTPILEELVTIRHQLANLLEYPTHTAFILADRMAKTTDTVTNFLADLKLKLAKLVEAELKVMKELKEEECRARGVEVDNTLQLWDLRYFMDQVEKTRYAVDHTVLRDYFPLPRVLSGMMEIYQQLLGVKFCKLEDVPLWHKDVEMYRVTDVPEGSSKTDEAGELLGYFFLDLHPRPGKFSHAAVFPLQPSCVDEHQEGGRQVTVCGMLCNMSKGSENKPALLEHQEVETLFHEFGHVMHGICSRANIAMFAGTSVDRDFVEAPSQMLENWVWQEETLRMMSGHYETGAPIPADLLQKLSKSRTANAGFLTIRQVALASYDQAIHSVEHVDTAAVYSKLRQEITGFPAIPDTNMPANFGHLGGGYDAQYYGYLWSEVFSMDMFDTRFSGPGQVLDQTIGREYRRLILQPGGSRDSQDMLRDFLGREPNNKAFLKSKGLDC